MSRNLTPFVPEELKLDTSEQFLMGVQHRSQQKIVPSQGQSGPYSPKSDSQIEFQWTHGDATDFASTVLMCNVNFVTGTGGTVGDITINSASDLIDRIEFHVDGTEVISSVNTNVSLVQNALMYSEFTRDYFEREGQILLGWNAFKYGINNGSSGKARTYAIPLWSLHCGFSQTKIFPVLGSNVRLVLHLTPVAKALNIRSTLDDSYNLTNVYLLEDRLILSPDYKSALMAQVKSEEGFKIHYIDYDITPHNIVNANSQNLVVVNKHSNALTLMLLNDYLPSARADLQVAANGDESLKAQDCNPNQFVDIARRVSNATVECGSLRFTSLRGSESIVEHFMHLERANGTLGKPNNVGSYNYNMYHAGVARGVAADANKTLANPATNLAFSPLIFSLEKTMSSDVDMNIVNKGLSATDPMSSRDIEVKLVTSASALENRNLNSTKERLYSVLVYEKALVMKQGTILVED